MVNKFSSSNSWNLLPVHFFLKNAVFQWKSHKGMDGYERHCAGYQKNLHSFNSFSSIVLSDVHMKHHICTVPPFCSQDGQSRTVRQFQFTDWPEQGVPKSGEGFIDFIGQVHKTKEQFGQDGPISVHCR